MLIMLYNVRRQRHVLYRTAGLAQKWQAKGNFSIARDKPHEVSVERSQQVIPNKCDIIRRILVNRLLMGTQNLALLMYVSCPARADCQARIEHGRLHLALDAGAKELALDFLATTGLCYSYDIWITKNPKLYRNILASPSGEATMLAVKASNSNAKRAGAQC